MAGETKGKTMRHDKRYDELDRLDNYELVNKNQDIRGLPLVGLTTPGAR